MGVTNRGMDAPDETRTFDHGQVEVVKIGGATIGRYTFEPGWRWSESVKPIAKTDSCQVHHVGYILTGRLHVQSDDGGQADLGPGDVYDIEPGHDGWVVGDESVTSIEFTGAETYAKTG
jgi:ethanolamine utilization protein EutQ (cupin superfamily)